MWRWWIIIRQLLKDIYWTIIAIIVLALLLMVVKDIYHRAYPRLFEGKQEMRIDHDFYREM